MLDKFFARFFPKMYVDSIFDIDYDYLKKNGITALVFDVDNTIVPHDVPLPELKHIELFENLKAKGFGICFLSNNKPCRVEKFNKNLSLFTVARARKPGKKGLQKALALLNVGKNAAAIIGDQFFTDIWCGNRSGVFSILVKPVSLRDEWQVLLKRVPEKPVLRSYLRKVMMESNGK